MKKSIPDDSVESCRFLCMIITQDLKWELNIRSLIKKAQQRMFFLRQLKKVILPKTMMVRFYLPSLSTSSPSPSLSGKLLPLLSIRADCSVSAEKVILAEPSHPSQRLFVTLPSGMRLKPKGRNTPIQPFDVWSVWRDSDKVRNN